LIANDRNRVRWLVLGLSQDGAFIDLYENHSENNLKGDLSNDTTVSPPLFSLVNTFNIALLDPASLLFTSRQICQNRGGWGGEGGMVGVEQAIGTVKEALLLMRNLG
jgi:hypothetical protein